MQKHTSQAAEFPDPVPLSGGCFVHQDGLEHSALSNEAVVMTDDGPAPIAWLKPGDRLQTFGGGTQMISDIATFRLSQSDAGPFTMLACAGVLVSPATRFLISDWVLELYIGQATMLIEAAMLGDAEPVKMDVDQPIYQLIMDKRALISVDGLWVEADGTDPLVQSIYPDAAKVNADHYVLHGWEAAALDLCSKSLLRSDRAKDRGVRDDFQSELYEVASNGSLRSAG
ncbi:Hint domain-containing protein [Litoreibacter roseus]|uniref:Hedgehog/Intein (Hint) domain-containing protein n=1 Tax=Litoreibacter roseus TaxID=2601869 RepID=A0A6N6JCD4_9RHOB|nr:Hint domain-containing protein [Litoreibacter roseus]GFE63069.1 hypothetical protein KIN_01430 [Litoreibacter roseus]